MLQMLKEWWYEFLAPSTVEKVVFQACCVLLFLGAMLGWFVMKFFEWLPFTIVYTGT